ncbi:MAG: spermidine/putrescine ABC transporter substrate-binding protein [Ruminococcaceae bacterium]|nr:spermidine/putrescine ABC transporter substrate-binding protein [Oscillospiraceae bacterium]
MKKYVIICLALVCLCLMVPLLCACDGGETVTLYVYNWGEYISDGSEDSLDVNAAFEEWYESTYGVRVKVNYSTYSSNEDMYAKLSSGATNYDIVVPSDYMIARMIDEGLLRVLNMENIPNAEYIDYSAMFGNGLPYYDPTYQYSVPYTYGTVGIIYNKTMVNEADLGTWDIMWNEKYTGNVLQFNNSRDAFATALFKLGYSVNTEDEAEWREALALLMEQKPIVQGYVMDEIFNKMENGSAAIAPYYAGDFFTMYDDNPDLGFSYPKEGTNVFVDAMCVPTSSKNPEIAERYINFMLTREAAIANAEYMCYASPNTLVVNDSEYRAYMADIHPDALEILYGTTGLKLEFYENLPEERLMLLNSLWEDLKIESPINTAIIVMAGAVLGGCVGAGVFFAVRARKRRRIVSGLWQ